jgi:hypothetical protein
LCGETCGWQSCCEHGGEACGSCLVSLKLVLQQLLEALDTAHATGIGELLFSAALWWGENSPHEVVCGKVCDGRMAVCLGVW